MPHTSDGFCSIEQAIEELRAGRMIVLVDDEHRENEGDVVVAAEKVTPAGRQLHDPAAPAAGSASPWPGRCATASA